MDQFEFILLAPTLVPHSPPFSAIPAHKLVLAFTELSNRHLKQPKITHESQVTALWVQAGLSSVQCKAAWSSLFCPAVTPENPDNMSYFRYPGQPRVFCGRRKVGIARCLLSYFPHLSYASQLMTPANLFSQETVERVRKFCHVLTLVSSPWFVRLFTLSLMQRYRYFTHK